MIFFSMIFLNLINNGFDYENAIYDLSPSLYNIERLNDRVINHYKLSKIIYDIISYGFSIHTYLCCCYLFSFIHYCQNSNV